MQVKYNVLERNPEKSGLLEKCQELGVTLVAHSPLQQGILTGAQCLVLLTCEENTFLKMRCQLMHPARY